MLAELISLLSCHLGDLERDGKKLTIGNRSKYIVSEEHVYVR